MNRYLNEPRWRGLFPLILPLVPLYLLWRHDFLHVNYPLHVGHLVVLWLIGILVSHGLCLIHELGHLIAGRLGGIESLHLRVGTGPKVVSTDLGSLHVEVRALPGSGCVIPRPSEFVFSRARAAFYTAGGLLAEATVGLIVFVAASFPADGSTFAAVILAYARITVVFLVLIGIADDLIPAGGAHADDPPNDGRRLLDLWHERASAEDLRRRGRRMQQMHDLCAARHYTPALQVARALMLDYPDVPEVRLDAARFAMELGDSHQAETLWRELLARDLPPSGRTEVLDSLACLPLHHNRTDLLAEAAGWIREALQLSPHAHTLRGTWGSLLIELNRIDEGITVLTDLLGTSKDFTDQMIGAAFLAKGYAARADHAAAAHWLKRAQRLDADHPAVQRITQTLAGSTTGI